MSLEKPPFIKHPEVQAEKDKYQEGLDIERLAFKYKVEREEMLSVFDEVSKYINYEDIIGSLLYEKLPEELKRSIEEHFESIKRQAEDLEVSDATSLKPRVLFADFEEIIKWCEKEEVEEGSENTEEDTLINIDELEKKHREGKPLTKRELQFIYGLEGLSNEEIKIEGENVKERREQIETERTGNKRQDLAKAMGSRELLDDLLYESIYAGEEKVVKKTASREEKEQEIEDKIEARAFGRSVHLAYLLDYKFLPLLEELSSYNEEDMEKIKSYGLASLGPAREALKKIELMERGVKVSKMAKNVEIAKSPKSLSEVYRVGEERVRKTNDRLERLHKRKTGRDIRLGFQETAEFVENIIDKDFVTAYVKYHREMRNMRRVLERGEVVETAYVREIIDRALVGLKKDPPSVVYFHGDFGTGKTAIAKHVSKNYFHKEPIIVAGGKFVDPERFTEEFRIMKLSRPEFLNKIAQELGKEASFNEESSTEEVINTLVGERGELRQNMEENYLRHNFMFSLEKKGKAFRESEWQKYFQKEKDNIPEEVKKDIQKEIDELFSNPTQGRYALGAMYTAMKEGRPLIIDEANALSPEVLITFNDLLTKRIGERLRVRSDEGEITIKEGYCIMWTGNTGERYKQARYNDMDPASYSRILPIQVNYLPQSTAVNNMQQLMDRLELDRLDKEVIENEQELEQLIKDSKDKARTDQIFQVLILKILNQRLGSEILVKKDDRYSFLKDLYRLSMGSRMIMDLFEGRVKDLPALPNLENIIGSGEPEVLAKKIKRANLTMRELIDNIIGGYFDYGQSMDVEYYLFQFIKKYDMHPEEQAILYALLQKASLFNPTDGWPNYQQASSLEDFKKMMDINVLEDVSKYIKVKANGDYVSLLDTGDYEYDYLSSVEALQILFGYLPPRTKEEYEAIVKKQKERIGDKEIDSSKLNLLESVRDCREALTVDYFNTGKEARNFMGKIKELKLSDKDFIKNSSEKEFLEEVDKFNSILLEVLVKKGKISQEDYERAEAMPTGEKTEFLKSILLK